MLKLKKYLKPYILLLLIAIGLLYLQAQMDLALPDYLSKIVNVGIQQSGVTDEVPMVLLEDDFDKMKVLLNEEVINSYTLESDHKHSKEIEGSLYILKDMSDEELSLIKDNISSIFMLYTNADKIFEAAEIEVPAGMDSYQMITMMPEEQRNMMLDKMMGQFEDVNPEMITQMNISLVKTYYEKIGLDISKLQSSYILTIGGIMVLVTIIGAVSSISVGFFASKIAAGIARNLRTDIFKKVLSFSNAEFDKFSTASLITRSTNDITQIQTLLVMMIRMVFYAPLIGVGGVIKVLDKNASMTWIIGLAVAVLLIVIITVFIVAVPKFKMIQKLVDKVNLIIREHLNGILVIRAFNTEKFEEKRFDKTNEELTKMNLFVNRVMAFLFPVMMLIMNGVVVLIIWTGANEIANANMQVGDMMAFMQYAMQIIMAFLMLSMMFIMLPRAAVSADRIAEVLGTDVSIIDPKKTTSFNEQKQGEVVFENVSFRYPNAEDDMLKNISFTAKTGQVTAIIGSTGSGKTTLVNLINRFYDTTKGSIKVNGVDIKEVNQANLRESIGYVPQKSFLFSGTIASNLKYGDLNAETSTLERALEISQGKDLITKEDGLNRLVAQAGANFSGGQKQRLSIARAVVKDPSIYIFDDSFSALDFKTDAALRRELDQATENKTMIIVAQRVSTVMKADQIIVLDDGNLVGSGTHEELLETCPTYYEIASSQLTKEEL